MLMLAQQITTLHLNTSLSESKDTSTNYVLLYNERTPQLLAKAVLPFSWDKHQEKIKTLHGYIVLPFPEIQKLHSLYV